MFESGDPGGLCWSLPIEDQGMDEGRLHIS